ncbi:glutamate--tRNA ligase, chloroplastic/mitochondrial isoform X1 [Neltuma alba]|uniref:glutamate--tRNA ligase, chloroplastic/mitochondrial isoform X1 n=1 Tax=Neltuma alba TaxID=207710 RepID=UPI0010A3D182|nr:glutamate--tRNA ligase, chloroplastic/mitochondrial-like isoform X1 [Prosopis alba]XP_028785752.1 glutamate--tRNA ligase, chloroplastic/mitochondrial-like isoform X1 [Prosopis alba]XP_028785753.1 glutamate--tRNA ligase, chloroplastic/mitochondrial-like isoform X1 [Prosopis alba]XP_028785754.1 glutamate--tRNA ligase, chloroplastic/mitochondrial-like isoform X1 [Prosopis alba]XP_028785755.1 glutamate--tRNA ligase, chloroplastic/mitochondrial-like isoform X1 [Prosopis alba]XP_028785758.1 gluta
MRMAILGGSPWIRMGAFPFEVSASKSNLLYRQRKVLQFQRSFSVSAFSVPEQKSDGTVRVRFAPSPTGNLHVGGARTALFNYLFARSKGGKLVLRIEDTDLERSTKESEEAMLKDLSWLGLDWDEGPGVGGDYGPYRQSERNYLYKHYADKLLQSGHVYRCFCSNEELEKMKEIAKLQQLPPVYTGKWASAGDEEVQEELERGTPYTYRFRVPKGSLKINDIIRGEVSWNLDTLGDFVIMRSNGQPVYNFCVTVDDATMAISHVIRAEEHLPNTLRQALIYKALGFSMPHFAHVSLILAPDRSKLSKRHGATSVGQFREMGYLPQAMVNYLALLGWGDGTEDEFFTIEKLVEKFTIERVNKSGAIFDSTKLRWMNGQHLRALPSKELTNLIGERWNTSGILTVSAGPFIDEAVQLLKDGIDLVVDADEALDNLLSYPLRSTLQSDEVKSILEDKLSEFSASLLAAYDSGEIMAALEEGHAGWQKWVKGFGKSLKRKGKSLFMPLRLLLTGKLHGPDMGASIILLHKAGVTGIVDPQVGFITLEERFKMLRQIDWEALSKDQPLKETTASISN